MPIASRTPEVAKGQGGTPRRSHYGGALVIGIASTPPEALFPSGGVAAPDPVVEARRVLALEALKLLRNGDADIADEVLSIRGQLEPIQTRQALAESFAREAFRVAPRGRDADGSDPVRFAYALRWLDLASRGLTSQRRR